MGAAIIYSTKEKQTVHFNSNFWEVNKAKYALSPFLNLEMQHDKKRKSSVLILFGNS
jgi:hypothetical protein